MDPIQRQELKTAQANSRGKVAVVGGGILGSTIAHQLSKGDLGVTLYEKDERPSGASVRNFGLVWISGRRGGEELRLALASRKSWIEVSKSIPEIALRESGSLTLLTSQQEVDAAKEAIASDPANQRELRLLRPDEVFSKYHLRLSKSVLAALECGLDAMVDPGKAVGAILSYLEGLSNVRVRRSTQVASIVDRTITTVKGDSEDFDVVIVATGAAGVELISPYGLPDDIGISTTTLVMTSSYPMEMPLLPAIADGDSLRYYPFFQPFAKKHLGEQEDLPRSHGAQLLARQLSDGTLIMGDSHYYDDPTRFKIDMEIANYFREDLGDLIEAEIPPIEKVWLGTYARATDPIRPYVAHPVADGVLYVTGAGGMGMTISWAIADEVVSWINARQ